MVPLVYHDRYQNYFFGPQHPFRPVRYAMALELLDALGHAPAPVAPSLATREDVLTVHTEALVRYVEAASKHSAAERPAAERRFGFSRADTPVFEGMDAATRQMAGGTLHAARLVASGAARHVLQLGGGLHHAHAGRVSGFCIYNDCALAVRYLTAEGLRVAYLDVDVHHGDGVQSIFYDVADVLTISLHESGRTLFPGTGSTRELGAGAGAGYTLNVPLAAGTAGDAYLDAFERVVPHALSWFQPDVLVVQCGADAHARDPLAHLMLTTSTYETLFRRFLELAEAYAGGRAVFTLGGGYDLDATPRVWALLALVLSGLDVPGELPEGWRRAWSERLGRPLSPTLHDGPGRFAPPDQEPLQAHNAEQCRRLMERAPTHWG